MILLWLGYSNFCMFCVTLFPHSKYRPSLITVLLCIILHIHNSYLAQSLALQWTKHLLIMSGLWAFFLYALIYNLYWWTWKCVPQSEIPSSKWYFDNLYWWTWKCVPQSEIPSSKWYFDSFHIHKSPLQPCKDMIYIVGELSWAPWVYGHTCYREGTYVILSKLWRAYKIHNKIVMC